MTTRRINEDRNKKDKVKRVKDNDTEVQVIREDVTDRTIITVSHIKDMVCIKKWRSSF